MTKTLEYIEEQINEATEMITHFRRHEEYVSAHRYETLKDKFTELKTIYLEEHGQ